MALFVTGVEDDSTEQTEMLDTGDHTAMFSAKAFLVNVCRGAASDRLG